jgi:DNA-binding MarR family transcriptional regulator
VAVNKRISGLPRAVLRRNNIYRDTIYLVTFPDSAYQHLEEFRFQIRRFLHVSESLAREAGLEPQQHQALLVLKGAKPDCRLTIRHLADRLLLKHHSAVGLADRLEDLGLVARSADPDDGRQVLLRLTEEGERILHRLAVAHRTELEQAAPELTRALRAIGRKTGATA